jgi:hypothetical protein
MRDDISDAYAAVDWARAQLPALEQEFKSWFESDPYLLIEEPHPEMGKKLFKLEINRQLPATTNAYVGAIINSTRTSLDLLASAIAIRNGKTPSSDRHFPIYATVDTFADPKNVAKRKKWLSDIDLKIIERLQPYRGGNDLLFALHHLDIKRKHEQLVSVHLTPNNFIITPATYRQGFEFPPVWPGFKDGAIVGWTNINATNYDFLVTAEVSFNETDFLPVQPVVSILRQFAGTAESIIRLFE